MDEYVPLASMLFLSMSSIENDQLYWIPLNSRLCFTYIISIFIQIVLSVRDKDSGCQATTIWMIEYCSKTLYSHTYSFIWWVSGIQGFRFDLVKYRDVNISIDDCCNIWSFINWYLDVVQGLVIVLYVSMYAHYVLLPVNMCILIKLHMYRLMLALKSD